MKHDDHVIEQEQHIFRLYDVIVKVQRKGGVSTGALHNHASLDEEGRFGSKAWNIRFRTYRILFYLIHISIAKIIKNLRIINEYRKYTVIVEICLVAIRQKNYTFAANFLKRNVILGEGR